MDPLLMILPPCGDCLRPSSSQEGTGEIDVDYLLPLFYREFINRHGRYIGTGIVEQDIQSAVSGFNLCKQSVDRFRLRDIAADYSHACPVGGH